MGFKSYINNFIRIEGGTKISKLFYTDHLKIENYLSISDNQNMSLALTQATKSTKTLMYTKEYDMIVEKI